MITQQELKHRLAYNVDTGLFTRLTNGRGSKTRIGDVAGATDDGGYVVIKLLSKNYKAHRLAWLYVHGSFPPDQIDHINGLCHDNRLDNLRMSDAVSNHHNVATQRNNTSGERGVCKVSRKKCWRACARFKRKIITLGCYETIEDAAAMYRWFTEATRGEFYREPI